MCQDIVVGQISQWHVSRHWHVTCVRTLSFNPIDVCQDIVNVDVEISQWHVRMSEKFQGREVNVLVDILFL